MKRISSLGLSLCSVLLLGSQWASADEASSHDKLLEDGKKFYEMKAKAVKVEVDAEKAKAFPACYATCREGTKDKPAQKAEVCGKQCAPELYPAKQK